MTFYHDGPNGFLRLGMPYNGIRSKITPKRIPSRNRYPCSWALRNIYTKVQQSEKHVYMHDESVHILVSLGVGVCGRFMDYSHNIVAAQSWLSISDRVMASFSTRLGPHIRVDQLDALAF
eukprot:896119-Amphidinium_carterae.1